MERIELPADVLKEVKEALDKVNKMIITFVEPESFRNVVPLFLEEVEEVKGEESLEVSGSAGSFKAFPLGSKTLLVSVRGDSLELAIVDVPFEEMKKFLKGEEEYEVDESSYVPEEGEEEEEEFEPE